MLGLILTDQISRDGITPRGYRHGVLPRALSIFSINFELIITEIPFKFGFMKQIIVCKKNRRTLLIKDVPGKVQLDLKQIQSFAFVVLFCCMARGFYGYTVVGVPFEFRNSGCSAY